MPDEAQLKAQIQAAIAKKKMAEQTKVEEKTPTPPPPPQEESVAPSPAIIVHQSKKPLPEDKEETISRNQTAPPVLLTFFGQNIRFTTYRGDVYFATEDILPLSNDPDAAIKYIEFKNKPSSKSKAESMIKTLTFEGENGTEKLDGSKANQIIELLLELKLSCPGPLSRWLEEISIQHKPKHTDKSEE